MALHVRNTDLVLTANARSQSSSVLFVNGIPGGDAMPALFTRMSMRPSTSRVRSTISFTSALLVTSHFIASTRRLSAFTSSAVFSALRTWMSGIAMSAPSLAIASTMPRPMPLPPPVTIATLPSSRPMHASVDIIGASEGHMTTHRLRSRNWFGRMDLDGFAHRAWLKNEGFSDVMFDGRPVVGIANSWSELTNCNAHLRQVADAVKRGVLSAGGFPLEFPTISLGEVLMKPTTMLFRNLMAMDVEECIRAYPLDAVVLLSGCEKTTPAMLMGAASADVPAIMVTGGPMLRGKWRTEELGSGTDVWRYWDERRAGRLSEEEWCEMENCISRSAGHCMVMGSGSTNAIIHLVAIAGRLGLPLPLARFDELSKTTPFLVNVRPSGKHLMEDFFYAGGLPAVLRALLPLLHGDAPTVNGHTLADNVRDASCYDEDVIRPLTLPLAPEGGTVILFGNLCPHGAVLK